MSTTNPPTLPGDIPLWIIAAIERDNLVDEILHQLAVHALQMENYENYILKQTEDWLHDRGKLETMSNEFIEFLNIVYKRAHNIINNVKPEINPVSGDHLNRAVLDATWLATLTTEIAERMETLTTKID